MSYDFRNFIRSYWRLDNNPATLSARTHTSYCRRLSVRTSLSQLQYYYNRGKIAFGFTALMNPAYKLSCIFDVRLYAPSGLCYKRVKLLVTTPFALSVSLVLFFSNLHLTSSPLLNSRGITRISESKQPTHSSS
jgi:hypothetical protein